MSDQPEKLAELLKGLNVKTGNSIPDLKYIQTGLYLFDKKLQIVEGRWYVLYGRPGSCKSTLSYYLAGRITQQKRYALILDIENSFNLDWAVKQGLDPEYLLYLAVDDTFEKAADDVKTLLFKAKETGIEIGMMVVDSIHAAYTKAEKESFDKTFESDARMASLAKKITDFLRAMTPVVSKAKCTSIIIGQARDNMGYAGGIQLTGGNALKHYAHMILRMSTTGKSDIITVNGQEIGWPIEVYVEKAKSGEHKSKHAFVFRKNHGIDVVLSNLRIALAQGIITRKGSFYYFEDQSFRGYGALIDALMNDESLQNKVFDKLR